MILFDKIYPNVSIGRWTVLEKVNVTGNSIWRCKCSCGTIRDVAQYSLKKGGSKSCGCETIEKIKVTRTSQRMDLIGDIYGRLEVLDRAETIRGQPRWRCRCICGNITTVRHGGLRNGNTRSCGCLSKEVSSRISYKHGKSHTKEHNVWRKMIGRCSNPNVQKYHCYGGRGINVCERWTNSSGFVNFLSDMGERPSDKHSIDRIDNNGNYEPSNCKWVTNQHRNKRTNRVLTLNGESKCMAEWSEITGIRGATILTRLKLGWSEEKAITTPARKMKKL